MAGRRLTRRDLLRGGLGEPAPAAAPKPIVSPGRTLPSVISWLGPGMRPTERRGGTQAFPLLRPPGAIAEAEFLEACTRCNDCAEACPYDAIRPAHARLRDAAGTPVIDPVHEPCRMCDDLPCIAACEPRALRPEAPAALGTARVEVLDCLNQLGSTCSVCIERCPVPGALTSVGAAPAVDDTLCTGCGVCQHVCPAPSNAIALLPNPERPTAEALDRVAPAAEPPLELPDLHEAELDETALRALFRDLAALAQVDEIRLKHAAALRAEALAPTLGDALDRLLAGEARAVQVRYRHGDQSWCDTILPAPGGHRVVRMAQPS